MISIIVPVYNVRKYLDDCIASIVAQTYRNWELLLIDDGSTDGSGEICDVWAERDRRIRVLHVPNGGVSRARNIGLDEVAGEYIFLTDSDDYLEPETLERLRSAITEHDAEMAVCNFDYQFETEQLRQEMSPKDLRDYQIHEETVLTGAQLLQLGDSGKYAFLVGNWNKLYSAKLFEGVRYHVGARYEDERIIHRLVYPCRKIALVPYVGYHYIQHSASFMHGTSNVLDYIDAMLDRCCCLTDWQERELTLTSAGRVLSSLKRAEESADKKELRQRKDEFFRLCLRLYRLGWISRITLLKRFFYCKLG